MTRLPALVVAAGLFSVVPVPPLARVERQDAARAVLWLPLLGGCFGLVAGGIGAGSFLLGAAPLLAAVLTIIILQGFVGAMHLDGLADTWDGLAALGSRKDGRDARRALEIMRQPDTGAMGVVAIVLTLAAQIAALASLDDWRAFLFFTPFAALTGRLAIPVNCRRGVPAAREGGFGALFCETVSPLTAAAQVLLTAGLTGGVGALIFTPVTGVWLAVIIVLVILAGMLWIKQLISTLGGVTGDLFGALNELTTTATLVLASLLV